MIINKSQILIIGTIFSAKFGILDIDEIFTEEIIRIASINPTPFFNIFGFNIKNNPIYLFFWICV